MLLAACDRPVDQPLDANVAEISFDGGDYATAAAKVAHGERLNRVFGCAACHGETYSGQNFGAMIPVVDGLWASNISLTMPGMSDAQLEKLLRQGVHPTRDEIYIMPSKLTQFLGRRDMDALIAYLRTIKPTGAPTPPPPPGFEASVAARLPDDYWRWQLPGQKRDYHNAAEEAAYFAANQAPKLGTSAELAKGRYVAVTVCSGCHGAALDGKGEDAGGIESALLYDDAEFDRLLTNSISRDGRTLKMSWGFGHEAMAITQSEKSAVTAYTRALAEQQPR
jgi:cytochrome c553